MSLNKCYFIFRTPLLEFAHYDYKLQGTIYATDFTLSVVAPTNVRQVSKFVDRVKELNDEPNLRDIRIKFKEFKNLAELRKRNKQDALRCHHGIRGPRSQDNRLPVKFNPIHSKGPVGYTFLVEYRTQLASKLISFEDLHPKNLFRNNKQ
ncbi:hypothetical protein HYC85_003620 [Camellia sinensis]|uniref:Uncharacterized protein n=1 Tax=Camellia sinensis TaxID=4442 RepID=A0A7J7HV76_CAMSI|nr:hypothetical protein HYC85_003620 [Camellia sinensis]